MPEIYKSKCAKCVLATESTQLYRKFSMAIGNMQYKEKINGAEIE
jgi:hypothetical protein